MLDWFSRERMSDEREEAWPSPPQVCQFLPEYALQKSDGSILYLSGFSGSFALIVLPFTIGPAETYLLESLPGTFRRVRPEITRVIVVTRSESLFTVVGLGGDLLFLADTSGNLVLHLAPDRAMVYRLGSDRQILDVIAPTGGDFSDDQFVTSSLRPTA